MLSALHGYYLPDNGVRLVEIGFRRCTSKIIARFEDGFFLFLCFFDHSNRNVTDVRCLFVDFRNVKFEGWVIGKFHFYK